MSIRRWTVSSHARATARVGLALQAYLYRTAKDVESLIPLGAAIRMVKGAYLEPPDVAYPKKADMDENFYRLSRRLMRRTRGARPPPAHGDPRLPLADRLTPTSGAQVPLAYEFAMLYGIQRRSSSASSHAGKPAPCLHQVRRVLVPLVHASAGRTARQRVVRRLRTSFASRCSLLVARGIC